MQKKKCVMIIAGEASGDMHGSNLINAIKKKNQNIEFIGIGGPYLKKSGVKIIVDSSLLAVVGITEVISKLFQILKSISKVKKVLKNQRPNLLILLDFPDFNLHIAKIAKKYKIPILYYISPQIWAWRSYRLKKIKKLIDHMAVIFPFEKKYFNKHDIPVTFVGHPLLDNICFQEQVNKCAEIIPAIGLLPGSRDSEISKLLPPMLSAAQLITNRVKNIKFLISKSSSVSEDIFNNIIKTIKGKIHFEIISGPTNEIFKRSKLILTASGTATLEAALCGVPMIIMYKVSNLSYQLGKALIKVDHIGLINLIGEKRITPELIQDEATPENISDIVCDMLNNPKKLNKIKDDILKTISIIGGPGASEKTAEIALNML